MFFCVNKSKQVLCNVSSLLMKTVKCGCFVRNFLIFKKKTLEYMYNWSNRASEYWVLDKPIFLNYKGKLVMKGYYSLCSVHVGPCLVFILKQQILYYIADYMMYAKGIQGT